MVRSVSVRPTYGIMAALSSGLPARQADDGRLRRRSNRWLLGPALIVAALLAAGSALGPLRALLAVPVLSGSAANAVGEMLPRRRGSGAPGHRRHIVYGIIVVATATGLIMNLFGLNPIATLFITAVINGIVAPPLLVLINLAAADRRVMGSRANGTLSRTLGWTTALVMAAAAIGLLVTTVAP